VRRAEELFIQPESWTATEAFCSVVTGNTPQLPVIRPCSGLIMRFGSEDVHGRPYSLMYQLM
jgi:hypothetical protein